MKRRSLFFILVTLLLSSTAIRADDAADLERVIAKLNRDAQEEGGHKFVLAKISSKTHIPIETLEAQMNRTHLSCGEIFAANSIAAAAGKTFDNIAGLRAQGQTWRQIVRDNKVAMVRGKE